MSGVFQSLTAADLVDRFGPIPLRRVRNDPPPGTATEEDVVHIQERENRACELIDGILVEKDVSAIASLIAIRIAKLLAVFVDERGLGFVLGEQALLRLVFGRVRIPDVCFIRRDQVPDGAFPTEPIADLFPTLAVEIISPGNTKREMDEKLDDYFTAGTELAWYVYPDRKEVEVYTGRHTKRTLNASDPIDGGSVLPGFSAAVAEFFSVTKLEPPTPST
jgi:Uma2 family endonuclease